MTDQELLEYAAKAVGWFDYPEDSVEQGNYWHTDRTKAPFGVRLLKEDWNPLLSDADAFRLMVLAGLTVQHNYNITWARTGDHEPIVEVSEKHLPPPYQASTTRRAIVRAAAEIGRAMTE